MSSANTEDVQAMKAILEAFGKTDAFVVNEAELMTAVQTEATPNGTRVGSWEIVVKDLGERKTYDVVNVVTREPIARDLYLYEASYGLVQRLNEGISITDRRVGELLQMEAQYARNRDDAGLFKERVKSARALGDHQRAAIAEDRFDASQRKAIEAHEEVIRLARLLRR